MRLMLGPEIWQVHVVGVIRFFHLGGKSFTNFKRVLPR